ncbi:hypothetical protein KGA66_15500 [Actinocrinis puniceicyclus]|uniref:Uncharacterized protein n=1 Tax=Actinocrinis puniceicyclus TaxID=977794 RepID=A0A8J8BBV7_9ACTN|nr:hypothetical protein [Actinocrinis puniceicyclus]MBS2964462.1 hypothetical protein [Actinocrinis puniceicyclus]
MGISAVTLLPLYIVLFLAATALCVYQDASAQARKGRAVYFSAGSFEVSTPVAWAVGCLCLWVFFMPLYITCRGKAG